VSAVCCQVEVSATGRSPVQRSPTDCGVSVSLIQKPKKLGGPGLRRTAWTENEREVLNTYTFRTVYPKCLKWLAYKVHFGIRLGCALYFLLLVTATQVQCRVLYSVDTGSYFSDIKATARVRGGWLTVHLLRMPRIWMSGTKPTLLYMPSPLWRVHGLYLLPWLYFIHNVLGFSQVTSVDQWISHGSFATAITTKGRQTFRTCSYIIH
jgi:hypothetical protein